MVYPFGCKYLDKLVLSLGQLISNMGFECVLDLVTTNGVQANSDRDLFILNHLEALKKGDRVLYFSYKGNFTSSLLQLHNPMHRFFIRCSYNALLVPDTYCLNQIQSRIWLENIPNLCA